MEASRKTPQGAPRKLAADREAWLRHAVALLRPYIRSKTGLYVPDVNISTGFTSSGARKTIVDSLALAECWDAKRSADKRCHVFIVPYVSDPIRVLDIVAHELLHAALGIPEGHGHKFATACKRLGLDGKPTATIASPAFRADAVAMVKRWLGAYPHPPLKEFDPTVFGPFDPSMPPGSPMPRPRFRPPQRTRMRLYVCDCGQKVRAATDTLDATHNGCGTRFALQ